MRKSIPALRQAGYKSTSELPRIQKSYREKAVLGVVTLEHLVKLPVYATRRGRWPLACPACNRGREHLIKLHPLRLSGLPTTSKPNCLSGSSCLERESNVIQTQPHLVDAQEHLVHARGVSRMVPEKVSSSRMGT